MTAALPGSWARLHPLSPVAKGGRAVFALLVVLGPRQLGPRQGSSPVNNYIDLAAAVLVIGGGVVSWLVTRWRVEGSELQVETGLLRRQSIRVPLVRVQAVDVVRPFIARVLGLSELRLLMAGGGAGKARLSYLPEARALEVRAQLLALAHGLSGDTPEAPERPAGSVPNGRLVGSVLLSGWLVYAVVVIGYYATVAVLDPGLFAAIGAGAVGACVPPVALMAKRLNTEFSFTVAESPDGLRLRSGLLQTRAETIPSGRVQALRLVEPLLWRPFGWCRLEVDVAQQRQREMGEDTSRALTRALLPVGSRAEADRLVGRVLRGSLNMSGLDVRAPRRARLKAPLSWHFLAARHDDRCFVARTGRLRAVTVIVPLEKVQSVRWSQGPAQRRLRTATVHVDTAGRRWRAAARDRSEEQAAAWLSELPDLARAARRSAAPPGERASLLPAP